MQAKVNVGDIFYSSWGYDQTNVDFYQVVAMTEKTVQLREIKAEMVEGDGWSGKKIGKKDTFIGDPIRKKIQEASGRPCFRIASFAFAYPWDGKPKEFTSYA